MRLNFRLFLVLVLLATSSLVAGEIRPVVSLSVLPNPVRLGGGNLLQQLQVTAHDAEGRKFDVTHRCTLTLGDEATARIDGTSIRGSVDGETTLQVAYGNQKTKIPVVVRGLDRFPAVHFLNDIMPLLSKLGCNSGGCHGKQSGQNGFKLSVFGFDPAADYNALVKEARGRRVFVASPAGSLLVAKATNGLAHGGGARTRQGSVDHELLRQWVHQGAPWGADGTARTTGIRVEPAHRTLPMHSEVQLLVTAVYSDGSTRDVTSAATLTSNAQPVADAADMGLLHSGKMPGEAAITINYMGHVTSTRITVPRQSFPDPYPEIPANTRIDRLVWNKLQRMGIVPSGLTDDATFLRRLHLDTIGTLPRPEEVRRFLADKPAGRRTRAIDAVLQRPELADYWAVKWGDILLVDRAVLGARGAFEFHRWLRQQLFLNRPYDVWARELLTATGNSGRFGPVNFFRAARTPEQLTRSVSQSFLGIRMDCAQCHHHPFEKWGQQDFFGMAGFFKGLQHVRVDSSRELVFHGGYQPTTMPLTGAAVPTRPPGGKVIADFGKSDPRVKLAAWVTSPRNPYFTRLVANRLWKHFLGRGLVEPEDDFRSTNPPTNPALLDLLAARVVESGFNLKAVMRQILTSRVYQLTSVPNKTNRDDEQNYSHFLVKRLPAPVLLDAISAVTGTPEAYDGMPRGTRAIQLWDNRLPSYFLDTFGRSERQSPCECGSSAEATMAQTLHLMNAPEIDAKVVAAGGRVDRLIARGAKTEEIIEDLCLAALGRRPRPKEIRVAQRLFSATTPRQAAEDFLWALLNSYDFLFVQ
ncbi:MAG: DUF1549 and DUF1553 domain-containing protein [Planctomycetaceae bacterium]